MKVDTDNLSEITIYGIPNPAMIWLSGLPINIDAFQRENPDKHIYLVSTHGIHEEIQSTETFVERTISLLDENITLNQYEIRDYDYLAYTCFFAEKRLEVTTKSDMQPIPQDVADKIIIYALFHNLKFETKKAE